MRNPSDGPWAGVLRSSIDPKNVPNVREEIPPSGGAVVAQRSGLPRELASAGDVGRQVKKKAERRFLPFRRAKNSRYLNQLPAHSVQSRAEYPRDAGRPIERRLEPPTG